MLKTEWESLYIKGNTKFQEIGLHQPIRQHQPKVNIIKLKGFQQFVDLLKKQQEQQEQKQCSQCQQCTPQLLPTVLSYPPRIEIQTKKASETKLFLKKSFAETPSRTRESNSLEKIKKDSKFILNKQFAVKRAITIKNEKNDESSVNLYDPISIALSNNLNITPPEKFLYKAFVTKGNNGILIRNSLKLRPWWVLIDQPQDEMNLYWTQLRKQQFYDQTQQQFTLESQRIAQFKSMREKNRFKSDEIEYQGFNQSAFLKVHNHLECNFQVCNKKALFYNMKTYYESIQENPFQYIPVTFHIQNGLNDPAYKKFEEYVSNTGENLWIIKPGESSNRGNGIQVANNLQKIKQLISTNSVHSNKTKKTFIVQKYMENPLLFNKRKFDIRCYMLMTSVNKKFKAYWYQEGYIRTSCKEFSLDDVEDKFIHLTNDAVQKKNQNYGKFETGNKISFNEFQKYLQENHNYNFATIWSQIKSISTDIVKATIQHLDPNQRFYTFELFGLDYMIDQNMKPWLIEVNTNPCLETCCPLLARLITHLIENTVRIAIDPMYPAPQNKKKNLSEFKNLFELIYSDSICQEQKSQPIIKEDDDEHTDVEDDN